MLQDCTWHPDAEVNIKEVVFKNGTTHLERRCSKCYKYLGYQPQEREDYTLFFGKHKGKTIKEIAEVDKEYLEWLSKQTWLKDKYKIAIDKVFGFN
jgi:hypothetical protein